jgi:hypothetical protein
MKKTMIAVLTLSTIAAAFAGGPSKSVQLQERAVDASNQKIVFLKATPESFEAGEWASRAFLAIGAIDIVSMTNGSPDLVKGGQAFGSRGRVHAGNPG